MILAVYIMWIVLTPKCDIHFFFFFHSRTLYIDIYAIAICSWAGSVLSKEICVVVHLCLLLRSAPIFWPIFFVFFAALNPMWYLCALHFPFYMFGHSTFFFRSFLSIVYFFVAWSFVLFKLCINFAIDFDICGWHLLLCVYIIFIDLDYT